MKTKFILFTLFAASAIAADLRVDHVTIAGRDLKGMRAKFDSLGIHTEYGGKHTNGLTEMALASFADGSYLELIAAQDPKAGAPGHYWGKFIDDDAGPCAWAIDAPDINADAAHFGEHVKTSGRRRPDGIDLKWQSASIGHGPQGTFFPFMIHDVTKRDLRAFPNGKPTMPTWIGIKEVYIAVRDLDFAVKRYREAFQLAEPRKQLDPRFGGETARFPGTPVILVAAKSGWVADRLSRFGEMPCAFGIEGPNGKMQLIK